MSEKHQETGTIILISDLQHISDNFQKREFVIQQETKNPEYPKKIKFEFQRDKCDILDSYKVGQEVTVHFNVSGRSWDGPKGTVYFVTLEAWRMEVANGQPQQQQAPAPYQQAPEPNPQDSIEDSEIPF